MPVGQKCESGDTIVTLEEYMLRCKNCLKAYILDFEIKAVWKRNIIVLVVEKNQLTPLLRELSFGFKNFIIVKIVY